MTSSSRRASEMHFNFFFQIRAFLTTLKWNGSGRYGTSTTDAHRGELVISTH